MEAPILSITGVTKRFGGLVAVRDISFEIQTGDILGLMGPNGAGKSTLLNIIAGEYRADSGIVKFKGHDITGLSPHKICHLGIAMATAAVFYLSASLCLVITGLAFLPNLPRH